MRRTIVSLALMVMLVAGFVGFGLIHAHAASNGQQVSGYCGGGGIMYASVQGYNQNGNYAFWSTRPYTGYIFSTDGWWWKGQVKVTVERWWQWKTFYVNVPVSQNGDWVSVYVC